MPCFPNILALFLNYLHEMSFNPKSLFKVNEKKKGGGGGAELGNFWKIENR